MPLYQTGYPVRSPQREHVVLAGIIADFGAGLIYAGYEDVELVNTGVGEYDVIFTALTGEVPVFPFMTNIGAGNMVGWTIVTELAGFSVNRATLRVYDDAGVQTNFPSPFAFNWMAFIPRTNA